MKYPFRNGDSVAFTEECVAYQLQNGKRNKVTLPQKTYGTVIHVDNKYVYLDCVEDDEVNAVVELSDWDSVKYHAPHESHTYHALKDAATFMASRCDLGMLAGALIHSDLDRKSYTDEMLKFLQASSACHHQAEEVNEAFNVGERIWHAQEAGEAE